MYFIYDKGQGKIYDTMTSHSIKRCKSLGCMQRNAVKITSNVMKLNISTQTKNTTMCNKLNKVNMWCTDPLF